jgi:hypothetical protein
MANKRKSSRPRFSHHPGISDQHALEIVRETLGTPKPVIAKPADPDTEPDWGGQCEVCGASPIVPATGMCGPCTFGEAETAGGNW